MTPSYSTFVPFTSWSQSNTWKKRKPSWSWHRNTLGTISIPIVSKILHPRGIDWWKRKEKTISFAFFFFFSSFLFFSFCYHGSYLWNWVKWLSCKKVSSSCFPKRSFFRPGQLEEEEQRTDRFRECLGFFRAFLDQTWIWNLLIYGVWRIHHGEKLPALIDVYVCVLFIFIICIFSLDYN